MDKKFKYEFMTNFWNKNFELFHHIYIGTNDYENDIIYLQKKISDLINNNRLILTIDKFITVSGGWFYLLAFIPNSIYIKNIYIYDINPIMLYIYNMIYILFC